MTTRKLVSAVRNVWFDSQQVGEEDLSTEQAATDQVISALINNHIGTGVLPQDLVQRILLDTDISKITSGTLDGKPISAQQQPSDTVLGVQLELELTGSSAAGRKTVKVAILGLDFNGDLQYDTFYFSKNEKQTTGRHYTRVLSVLFNDMLGSSARSFNLGGRLIVREASPFSLSRSDLMIGQTVEPNVFFRDFFLDNSYATLGTMLSAAISGFNIDNLGISTSYKQLRKLLANDVTTQLGQKFQAQTTNIQKVTLLMAVENTVTPSDLAWSGDLVVSLYALQSSVASASDLVPELAIDFTPSNLPLAQVSFNFTTLQTNGIVLDGNLQPVDFVFSNTPVANGTLTVGSYYALTVKRSGSANKCNILMPVGSDTLANSRVTIFNGTTWVDVQEEDLWFRVSTDAVKVTDGQAYDSGQGVYLPKTIADSTTGSTVDNIVKNLSFSTSLPFYGVVQADTQLSVEVQDQRTGNPVMSRQQLVPDVNIINSTELTRLQSIGEPLVLGSIQDKNNKIIDTGTSTISANFYHFGLFKNKVAIKINEINGDPKNNIYLLTSLLNGDLVEAKFTPNTALPNIYYRIANAEVLTMIYGDVNGDGIVSSTDASLASGLLNETLLTSPSLADYNTSTQYFTTSSPITYSVVSGVTTLHSGVGSLTVDAVDGTVSTFVDQFFDFTTIPNLLTCQLVLSGSSSNNNGTFNIIALPSGVTTTVQINKIYRNVHRILSSLRADIGNDGYVGSDDVSSISNYALGVQPIPPSSSPQNRIGTTFRVLLLTIEGFTDRNDNYTSTINTRAASVHPTPDVVIADNSFANHNFISPIQFSITKRLTWRSDLIFVSAKVKPVPAIFSSLTAPTLYSPIPGVQSVVYPAITEVDPGRNDLFVPSNLVLGAGGQFTNVDGSVYKIDYEVNTITLNIPVKDFATEKQINIFTDFVADYYGNGTTRLGRPAMRFADGSFVKNPQTLTTNQIRFSVGIQAFSPDIDGLSTDGYSGVIVDDRMGVYLDPSTGILRLNFSHVKEDLINLTLSTKVQVTFYLKKSGFNNQPIVVDSATMANILGLT